MDPIEPIRSIKHGTVVFEYDDTIVYVDPYQIDDEKNDADLVIITHSHYDHFSPRDLKKIHQPDTCYVTTPQIAVQLEKELDIDRAYISHLTFDAPPAAFECGALVTPVPAHNINHELEAGFGLCLDFAGFKYYISSDTDIFAESVNCDVLFAVCDGIYNMKNYLQEVPAQIDAMDIKPKIVIPYHCSPENAKALCAVLKQKGIECKLFK